MKDVFVSTVTAVFLLFIGFSVLISQLIPKGFDRFFSNPDLFSVYLGQQLYQHNELRTLYINRFRQIFRSEYGEDTIYRIEQPYKDKLLYIETLQKQEQTSTVGRDIYRELALAFKDLGDTKQYEKYKNKALELDPTVSF